MTGFWGQVDDLCDSVDSRNLPGEYRAAGA
jgi:hypothetical protein